MKKIPKQSNIYEEKKEDNINEHIIINPPNLQIDGIINDLKKKGYKDFQIKEIVSSIQNNNNIIRNRVNNHNCINIKDIKKKEGQILQRNNSYKNKLNGKHRNKYNNYNTKIYISKNVCENKNKLINDISPKNKLIEKSNREIEKPTISPKNDSFKTNKKTNQNDLKKFYDNNMRRNKLNNNINDNYNNYSFYCSNDKKPNDKELKSNINNKAKIITNKGRKIFKYTNKKHKNVMINNINNSKNNKNINIFDLNNNKIINSKNKLNTIENINQDKNDNKDNKYIKKDLIINEAMKTQISNGKFKNNLFYKYINNHNNSNPNLLFNSNGKLNNKHNNSEDKTIKTCIRNIKNNKYNNYCYHDISKEGISNKNNNNTNKYLPHYDSNMCLKRVKFKGIINKIKNDRSTRNVNNNESIREINNSSQSNFRRMKNKKLSYNNTSQKVIYDLNNGPKKVESTHNLIKALNVEHNTISLSIEPAYKKEDKNKDEKKIISHFKERRQKENNKEISQNQNLKCRNNSENKKTNNFRIEKSEINFISNKKLFEDGQYEGIIINGKREIRGTMKYKNGSIYKGQWKNDKWHGKGIYRTQNYNNPNFIGLLYEGEFNNDKIEGYGTGKYSSGDQYEGEWKNNKQYGRGILYYVGGGKYIGEWKYGKLDGEGIYYLKNGERFEGKFMDNKYNGYGKYYYKNGDYLEGIFKDDLPSGDCILHKIDGITENKHFN